MPTLFLRVLTPAARREPDDPESLEVACQWLIREDDGRERASGETDFRGLRDLADPAVEWIRDPTNVVVFVPAGFVFTIEAAVPGKSVGHMRRALPFVIEEFIADDIERMHIAIEGAPERGKPIACCVIDRTLVEGWVDAFSSMGFVPGFMVPEGEMLPREPGTLSLLADGEQILARMGAEVAVIDRSSLELVLSREGVARIELFGTDQRLEAHARDQGAVVEVAEPYGAAIIAMLANRWRAAGAINLLQNDFLPRRPRDPRAQRWANVGLLAAVWAGIFLLTVVVEGVWSGLRADQLESESLALYRDIYPDDSTATAGTMRRRMAAQIGGAGGLGGRGFVEYVADLAAVKNASVTIVGLTYAEGRAELLADLRLSRYEDLEALKEALAERGVTAEVTSAEKVADGVRARMRLST
jgi:general secretion pathway protein L